MVKRLLLALLLLFLVSSLAFSQDVSEMTQDQILTELIENLELRENLVSERESALTQREFQLTQDETNYNARVTSLTAIESFSQSLREEVRKDNNASFWKGFGMGFASGFVAGGVGGFTLGVKLPL